MQEPITEEGHPHTTSRARQLGIRIAVIAAFTLVCSILLPALPILLGVLLIVAVALHAWSRELRPYVDHLLRMPVARPAKRRARLSIAAGIGGLLIASGAVGATTRGHLRSEWEQHERRREVAEEGVTELLERARDLLDRGNVEGAELLLLDAEAIATVDTGSQEKVEDLLEQVHRSGDSGAILEVLVRLSEKEFEAFREGASVPKALEFDEPALTARAVELAFAQVEEARDARARR